MLYILFLLLSQFRNRTCLLIVLTQAAWEALGNVIGTIPKETLPSLLKVARDAVSTARDKERRKRKVSVTYSVSTPEA